MTLFARVRSWLAGILRRDTLERDMDEELRFHIETYAADLVNAGIPHDEAQRRARAEFGGVEARKDDCREARGLRLIDEVRADARYALRQLRRAPMFTLVAILSLGLGIGANTAIFSLMEQALWKTMPIPAPEELRLFIWVSGRNVVFNSSSGNWRHTDPKGSYSGASFSYPIFEGLQQRSRTFASVFAFKSMGRLTAVIDGQAELVGTHLVSGNLYDSLRLVPIVGRGITPGDDATDAGTMVAVISDGFWARRFGRAPSVIGRTILVNQAPVTIVGINPPGFSGLASGQNPDIFLPFAAQPRVAPPRFGDNPSLRGDADNWWLSIMGRLRPGVTEAQAESETDLLLQQLVRESLPDRGDRDQPHMRLLTGSRGMDNLRAQFAQPLFVLLSFVGLVLLIACANVANLLLARAAGRRRELGLRLALGAGRARIARQLLTEGLTLGIGGGLLGLMIGYATRDIIPSFMVQAWERGGLDVDPRFDLRVLLLSAAVTIATSVLFSLAPIWHFRRVEVNEALKDGRSAGTTMATTVRGKTLIVFQVALCVLLLVGAGLFVRTLSNLRTVTLGFRPEHLLLFEMDPPYTRYKGVDRTLLYDRIEEAIAAIPGVESATLSAAALVAGGSSTTRVGPDGTKPKPNAHVNDVGVHYMDTMGIPILAGRNFDPHDRGTTRPPVVLINQQFARTFFPNQNPVGHTLRNNDRLFEIVGVCGDTLYETARAPVPPTFYRLSSQSSNVGSLTMTVRTNVATTAMMAAVRQAVDRIDKDLPVFDVRTQTAQIDATLANERLFATLTVAFGLLALSLACVGIYGVIAHNVARRTSEIGIRIALGAARIDVLLMILRESARLALAGVLIGAAAATWFAGYLKALLFGIEPIDPLTISIAITLMLLVALFATWLPARHAARLDPMVALRND
jgi:predicted permease